IPVLCGGAAINSDYINRIAKGNGEIYKAGIFYCKTAFEGLKVMNNLMSESKEEYMNKWLDKLSTWKERKYNEATNLQDQSSILSNVKAVIDKPVPPKFNFVTRLENNDLPLEEIWQYLNKKSLFVLSWGLRGKQATELKDEYDELLREWKVKVVKEKLFDPHAVYAYFRCRRVRNNSLLVKYQDNNNASSELIFEFPRSSNSTHLCLADYFDSESDDVVAFQSVTMGNKVTHMIDEWNKQGRYTDAYYLHGLAVETTEALADWVNYRIKAELGLKVGGLRYSWGYPSCPDITQHFMVWKLMNPSISGMTLTESGQIDPEFSTAAIVVHNPVAQYFTL
ncbi:MAG TPA: vitamin B12 dependent-methionine synthase activation domain-containing protein, partial [Candidatus Nitrosocosmicus sp.]|nr:vitamin B12 dependent-methionine synthase activation domain-containing protein [Candidatus Nitrosocosmicus sp.]